VRAVTVTTGRVRLVRAIVATLTTCSSIQAVWIGTATTVTTGDVSVRFASSVRRIYQPQHANKKA